jgi:hypothetical protein
VAPAFGYSKRSRLDKLGVGPGMRVAVLGVGGRVVAFSERLSGLKLVIPVARR